MPDDKRQQVLALLDEDMTLIADAVYASELESLGATGELPDDVKDQITAKVHEILGDVDRTTSERATQYANDRIAGKLTDQEFKSKMDDLFGPSRQESIAATATTAAYSIGAVAAFDAAGIDDVLWMTQQDELVDDDCLENEAAGAIPLGEAFPSGHDAPPAHPNCRCYLEPVI